ncbi:TPA: fimbrial protein [Serratia marcescens]
MIDKKPRVRVLCRELQVMILLLLSAITSWDCLANSRITISGVVMAKPACVINNNNPINVDFEEISKTKIDGLNYIRDIDYTIDCGNIPNSVMKMQIRGDSAAFDKGILPTSITNLGIRFYASGRQLDVNNWFGFLYPQNPRLQAVPVKNLQGELKSSGNFTAGAMLIVEYM